MMHRHCAVLSRFSVPLFVTPWTAAHQASLSFIIYTHYPSAVYYMHRHCAVLSRFSVPLFGTLWTVAHQAPLSMGFSGQEYWSGLPFPSPLSSGVTLNVTTTARGTDRVTLSPAVNMMQPSTWTRQQTLLHSRRHFIHAGTRTAEHRAWTAASEPACCTEASGSTNKQAIR